MMFAAVNDKSNIWRTFCLTKIGLVEKEYTHKPESVMRPPIDILPSYKWLFCSFSLLCAPSCAPLHLAIARYAFDES